MIRALSTQEKRSRTLRAIAERFWTDPNASIAVLADAAGLSRRTLYRIAATRGELIRLLHQEAVLATRRAMDDAGLDAAPWQEALRLLVERFVLEGPIYAFWVIGSEGNPDFEEELRHYRSAMVAFFERAREDGGLLRQYSAVWMLEAFDGLLLASLSARRHGSVPLADLPALVLDAFIRAFGASPSGSAGSCR